MPFDRAIELLGGKCHTYTCDLTKRADVYSTCEKIKREVGSVSILINNAGIVGGKSFLDLDDGNGHFSAYINSKENFYINRSFLISFNLLLAALLTRLYAMFS